MSEWNLGRSFHNQCTAYSSLSEIVSKFFFTHPEFAVYPPKKNPVSAACGLAHSILGVELAFCNRALLINNCPPACSLLWVWTFDGTRQSGHKPGKLLRHSGNSLNLENVRKTREVVRECCATSGKIAANKIGSPDAVSGLQKCSEIRL